MTTRRPRFAVVTDSAADLSQERAAHLGVHVVPLPVNIGSETFDDGALTQEELFRRMRDAEGATVSTSQPSPGTLAEVYERALQAAEEVIAVHLSSRLSGTCDAARIAARQFEGRVHVFDSLNLSWGTGWQVVEAVAAANEGLSATEALPRLEHARSETRIVVTLDSLERLNRSGRIGPVATYVGALLNVKVSVAVSPSGAFVPVRGSRSDGAALRSMLAWMTPYMHGAAGGSFAVGHALAPERAQALATALRDRWEVDDLIMYEAGSAISVHAGTIWGVAFRPRR